MAIAENFGMPSHDVPSPSAFAEELHLERKLKIVEDEYKKFNQALDQRVAAFKRDEAPIQKLSPEEQAIADSSVQHVRDLLKAMNGPQPTEVEMLEGKDPVRQAQLDLAHDLSCLSHTELQKILPSINAELEPSGLRLADVPENKELYLGKRGPDGGWVPYEFATGLVGCSLK